MSRLAAEAGLGQSSLYYYFRNREEVVAALVAAANVVPLELTDAIAAGPGSVASKLYRFVQGDVEALCGLPFDINEIHRIAARERDRFADYWRERDRLERRLAAIVREGVEAGETEKAERGSGNRTSVSSSRWISRRRRTFVTRATIKAV